MFITQIKTYSFIFGTRLLLSSLLLFLLISNNQAQPLVEWTKGFGGILNDIPHSIELTSNGEIVIAGQSASVDGDISSNNGEMDLWVTKLDENGSLIWSKNYGGSADDFAMDIRLTSDGGYVMTGGTVSSNGNLTNNNGGLDLWVIKINSSGELTWSKNYGGSGVDVGTSIQPVSDGYIIAGCTGSAGEPGVSAGNGGNEFWIVKLDLNGDLIWEKTYGGKRHDAAKTILENNSNEFLIGGNTWSTDGDISNSQGQGDAWVIKIDNVGVLLWEKTFGGTTVDRLNNFSKTNDGNYIFAGLKGEMDLVSNGFYGRYDEQYWILKFSETGQMIWEQTFGGSGYDEAFSVEPTMDGGYIIGGSVRSKEDGFSNNSGDDDIWIIKTNSVGEEEWTQLYGGAENEIVKSVDETDDGGFLMLGFSSSPFIDTVFVNNGFEDWWVVKLGGTSVNVNLGNDFTVCENQPFTLNANVAGCNCTYLWNDGSTDATRNLSISQTTTYSVTVTNSDGVEGVDMITVSSSLPQVTTTTQNIPCFGYGGGTINLIPSGSNYTYNWSNGSTTSTIDNLQSGTYTYTVTDGNGCTIEGEETISEPPAVTISENIIEVDCNGNSTGSIDLSVSGGAGNFQYAWADGQTTQDIYNLEAGGYTITITDMNGCIKVQDWVVNQPPMIDIGATPFSTTCFDSNDGGAQMSVNGGVGNFSYLWSDGSVNKDLSEVIAGTYTLTVTDGNFCEAVQAIQVTSPDEIIIEETVQNTACFGNNTGSISTQVSGGVGSYQYSWSTGQTTPNISQLSSGTYTLTITDDNFCEKIKEIVVSQNTDIIVGVQLIETTCHDSNDGSIDISPTGGVGDYSYAWSTGAFDQDLDNLGGGDYIVTITDGSGCEEIQLFTIESPDSISIFSNVFEISCSGIDDGMIQTNAFGGNGDYGFLWDNNAITSSISSLSAGDYTLTVTDIEGCEQTETYTLIEPDPIVITPTITDVSCYGISDGAVDIMVEGNAGAYIVDWSGGSNSNLPSGDYSISVTDSNNCQAIENIFISQPDSLYASIVTTDPINGNDGNIIATPEGGTPPFEFDWNNGMWNDAEISDLSSGIYDLILTDGNGCIENVSVLLFPVSVFEIESLETFEIFPNPNDGTFFLKLEFEKRENIEVSIINELGQVLQMYNRSNSFILEKTNLLSISSGLYFIKIKTESGVAVKRLVIQK